MKKVLLGLLFTAFGFGAMAQQVSPVAAPKGFIPEANIPASLKKNPTRTFAKDHQHDTVQAWYNVIDSARNFTTFTGYNNSYMFPDSLVKQIYGDGAGGQLLSHVNIHSMGQIFDARSTFLQDSSPYINGYILDSVAILYGYTRHTNGAPDTLVFQFYTDETGGGIQRSTFTGTQNKTAMVGADANTSLGTSARKEYRYILDYKDTATALRVITVPVPGGLLVPAKQGSNINNQRQALSAFTVTFKPGYEYELGDTLDSRWNQPTPTKLLNSFRILVQNDPTKEEDNSYNHSLSLIKAVKYRNPNFTNWFNRYIPGDAWNDYRQHLYSFFHITWSQHWHRPDNSIADLNAQGYALGNIFPNPAQDAATLEFALGKNENVKVQIFNVIGQHVQTVINGNFASGKHTLNINTEGMKPGVYLYTIQAGNYTQTKRFSVVK